QFLALSRPFDWTVRREQTELNEVIAASARPQLRPGPTLIRRRHWADAPIIVHDVVLTRPLEVGPDAETRFRLDGARQTVTMVFKITQGEIQYRHLHATGDIDPDRIRHDRVIGREHSANRQPVANVGVRHER